MVLSAWGSRLPVIPLNWQAIAGARSELARPREQLAHRAARRGIRCPRYLLLALLWAVAGGGGLVGCCFIDGGSLNRAVATLHRQRCSPNSAQLCPAGLTLMVSCRPAAAAPGLAARDSMGRHVGRAAATGWSERGSGGSSGLTGGAA